MLRKYETQVISAIARSIVCLLPQPRWYPAMFWVSRRLSPAFRWALKLTRFRNDARKDVVDSWLVNTLLQRIDDFGKPFPIPISIKGAEALAEAWRHPQGVVVCSSHLPLANVISRAGVELNLIPTAVLAGREALRDGMYPVWGCAVRLPALPVDKFVLIKVRSILRHGGSIATMVDLDLGEPVSPNVFRLIRSVGARAVFATVELQRTGEIQVQFCNPPDPFNRTHDSILANVEYFEAMINRIVHPEDPGPRSRGKWTQIP